jgi:sporulation protein YlmC with PRC-barrel domain
MNNQGWDAQYINYWKTYITGSTIGTGACPFGRGMGNSANANGNPGSNRAIAGKQHTLLATQTLPLTLVDEQGHNFGSVNNIVLDLTSGQIAYLIVTANAGTAGNSNANGNTGVASGPSIYLVPPPALSFPSVNDNVLKLTVNTGVVTNSPSYTAMSEMPDMSVLGGNSDLRTYWAQYFPSLLKP